MKIGAGFNNVLHRQLPCGLGKVLGGSLGSEDRQRGDGGLAATAEAQAPASRQFGLANTRVCKLGVCEERVWTCSGGQGNGRGDELTEAASMADGGARWRGACARGRAEDWLIYAREVSWRLVGSRR
jgi:hypothetical protein